MAARREAASEHDGHACSTTTAASSPAAAPPSTRPGPRAGSCSSSTSSTHTATLVAQYPGGGKFDSEYMGDAQPLAERQRVRRLGLGTATSRSTAARASCCLEANFPGPDLTYRATSSPGSASRSRRPRAPPRERDGRTTVYASWNGATRVASWRVLAGAGAGSAERRRARRQVRVRDGDPGAAGLRDFQLQALDADGRVIGTSRLFTAGG